MTSYYKVLRPVEPADLDAPPRIVEILEMIPPDGYVTSEHFKTADKNRAVKGIMHACSSWILKRVSPYERIRGLNSVEYWRTQLNESGYKNSTSKYGTRQLYLRSLSRFDEWLPGRSFQSYESAVSGGTVTRQAVTKSFANVEELMEYCNESDYGTKTAQRAVREYLTGLQEDRISASVQSNIRAAIKSYFNAHEIVLALPKPGRKRSEPVQDDDPMTLEDFYRMLQNGNPGIKMRTIMLIKLQSGMDSSTLTDGFNYEGYSQIVRYFKTDDHKSWNLEMCPVPIKFVRVKTDVPYTTFLDRDAVSQLREYLTWKETKYGKQDPSKPLFVTQRNMPIYSEWVSRHFSQVAVRAGIQKKVSHMLYKIRAHEVRHLLKSTLMANGCAQYVADHVLEHAPRDTYEKQALLYPEKLRAEYAKASSLLNIFSKVESALNTAKDPESQDARIRGLEEKVLVLKEEARASKAEVQASKAEVLESKEEAQELRGKVLALKEEAQELRGKVLALKEEAQELRGKVLALKEEAQELRGKVLALKEEARASKEEARASKAEVLESKEEVLESKEEVLELRGKVLALKEEARASKAWIGTLKQSKTEADFTESGSKHDANEMSEKLRIPSLGLTRCLTMPRKK